MELSIVGSDRGLIGDIYTDLCTPVYMPLPMVAGRVYNGAHTAYSKFTTAQSI